MWKALIHGVVALIVALALVKTRGLLYPDYDYWTAVAGITTATWMTLMISKGMFFIKSQVLTRMANRPLSRHYPSVLKSYFGEPVMNCYPMTFVAANKIMANCEDPAPVFSAYCTCWLITEGSPAMPAAFSYLFVVNKMQGIHQVRLYIFQSNVELTDGYHRYLGVMNGNLGIPRIFNIDDLDRIGRSTFGDTDARLQSAGVDSLRGVMNIIKYSNADEIRRAVNEKD